MKISFKWSVIVLGVAGILFSSLIIFFPKGSYIKRAGPVPGEPKQDLAEGSSVKSIAGSELPIRLKIPVIGVDAAVEYVGLTPDGAMDVPKGPADLAWFKLGPRPGEMGSAIISGHYGWKNSIPAVFDNLYKLRKGDKLYVEDEKGATTTFVVRELRTYGENEKTLFSGVFGSSDGKAHLNLITCEGVWNKTKKSYSNRLVVFTDKEAE